MAPKRLTASLQTALQDAKSRFSEVVEDALHKGPQWVTRRGMDAVVIVAASDYRKITTAKGSLVRFFRESPLVGVELDLTRSKETAVGEVAGRGRAETFC